MYTKDYKRESNTIKRPQPTRDKRYKADAVGVLNMLKEQKIKIQEMVKECRQGLEEIDKEEQMIQRNQRSIGERRDSPKKERELSQLEEIRRGLRQEKRELRGMIQRGEQELERIKQSKKEIKKKLNQRRIAKGARNVLKVIIGTQQAANFMNKHKKGLILVTVLAIGAFNVVPLLGGEQGRLASGGELQEINIMNDIDEEKRGIFVDSLKVDFENVSENYVLQLSDVEENQAVEEQAYVYTQSEDEMLNTFLENFEGRCRLEVHDLGDGVLTMGWGHTEPQGGKYNLGDTITKEEAIEFYKQDRANAYRIVDNAASSYPDFNLAPHQRNALASFAYNTGGGKVPELLEAYTNGDGMALWDNMKCYVFGNNKFYPGLTSRRVAEYLLFMAKTPQEIEAAYGNTYESINENHRRDLYKEEDLIYIRSRIRSSDTDGKIAINEMINSQREIERN